jgi:hypothetical protein
VVTNLLFSTGISPAVTPELVGRAGGSFASAVEAAQARFEALPVTPPSTGSVGFEGVVGKAQEIIDLGNALGGVSPATSGQFVKLPSSAGIGSAGVDLSGILRAYDFAMRSYLLSKMVTETAGSLKSLWQAP